MTDAELQAIRKRVTLCWMTFDLPAQEARKDANVLLAEVERLRREDEVTRLRAENERLRMGIPLDAPDAAADFAIYAARRYGEQVREACAKIAESHRCEQPPGHVCEEVIAAAIRARTS